MASLSRLKLETNHKQALSNVSLLLPSASHVLRATLRACSGFSWVVGTIFAGMSIDN